MVEETEEERFIKELLRRGLSDSTITQYMIRWRLIPKDIPLTEQVLYDFLDMHSGSVARAFVKIYADYHKLKSFQLPKRTGRPKKRLVNIMTKEEYEKLRVALYKRNTKFGLMFDLSYWCGLRREEVCNVAFNWFVFDNWEEGKACRLKVIGKGNKQRLVIVPAWLVPDLLKYMEMKATENSISEDQNIFGIGVNYWWRVFTTMSKRVLGKHYKPHELRHTRTVEWQRAGLPIDKASKRLGHGSISTTERYWHLDPEEVAKEWEQEVS